MTESECLTLMKAPGQPRESKWLRGVIQIIVTSSCDKACCNCTQASNVRREPWFMPPALFEQALLSLKGYFGVVGVFGGNPALHPQFGELCRLMREHVPFEQRGIWCNNPLSLVKAQMMRETYNPAYSNLNVHLDQTAYNLFKAMSTDNIRFKWVSGVRSLQIDCPKCTFEGEDPSSEDSGPYYLTITNTALANAADNDELTMVLINTVVSVP